MRRSLLLTVLPLVVVASCDGCDDTETPDISGGDGTDEVREIVLMEPPTEAGDDDPFSRPRPELRHVLDHIDAVRERDEAKGLFLRLGPMLGQWGIASDIAYALSRLRESGKPVHCHFEMADNVSYALLARSCDRISMTPAGYLDLVGVAAHVFYARSLLEHIGVTAELMQMGRFKGAADPFTRDDMPAETRESLGAILDDLSASLAAAVARRADISEERATEIIDSGPFDSIRARELGLVDDVGFDDEAREHARLAGGVERVRTIALRPRAEPMGLGELLSALAGEAPTEEPEGRRLVVAHLDGTIVDAEQSGPDSGRSGPFVRAFREMADDDDVAAIVLRIDSPGGSALASDRMWHAVRRAAGNKPVIVSIGNMAASGGYYIASAADEIFAHDVSLVGSIGVVGGKINVAPLAERIGVNVVVIPRGRNAAWTSPARGFSDSERETLETMLRTTYHRFLRRIAQGREMPRDRILAAAAGRLVTGRRARELGIVDAEGGLAEAIARAREAADLPDDVTIERWPRRRSPVEALAELMGAPAREESSRRLLRELTATLGPIADATLLPMLFEREPVAVSLPYVIWIR